MRKLTTILITTLLLASCNESGGGDAVAKNPTQSPIDSNPPDDGGGTGPNYSLQNVDLSDNRTLEGTYTSSSGLTFAISASGLLTGQMRGHCNDWLPHSSYPQLKYVCVTDVNVQLNFASAPQALAAPYQRYQYQASSSTNSHDWRVVEYIPKNVNYAFSVEVVEYPVASNCIRFSTSNTAFGLTWNINNGDYEFFCKTF